MKAVQIIVFGVAAALASTSAFALSHGDVMGEIRDGINPSETNEENWASAIVLFHNSDGTGANPFDTPTSPAGNGPEEITILNFSLLDGSLPSAVFADKLDPSEGDDISGGLGAGFLYALGKYGTGQDEQISVLFYLGGTAFDVPDNYGNSGGLSHVALFTRGTTQVPDGGATAALLGLGFLGLAVISRKRS